MAARTPAPPLPLYVEYGGIATTPQPDLVEDCVLYGFFPKANLTNLQSLCDKVFAKPSNGAVTCTPLLDRVMLTFGKAARIRPQLQPFNQMGYAVEQQVAFWIPVEVSQTSNVGSFPKLAWFVPYMWVDNPLSLSGGREIFGWAKNWGSMTLDPQGCFELLAYGGNFDPSLPSGYFPLVKIAPVSPTASTPQDSFIDTIIEWLFREALILAAEGFRDLFTQFVKVAAPTPIVFLKQFRSVSNGLEASLQEITGAKTTITRLKSFQAVRTKHQLTIHLLHSHPIAADLGVTNQTLSAGFQVKMDFTLQNGITLWP
jgi:hypothetical protein